MKKILIINPFGIGDVIFTMTVVEALRHFMPEATLDFLCNERTVGLVRLNTSINRTFVFNRDEYRRDWLQSPLFFFKKLRGFLSLLRREGYDTMLDFSLGREYSFFAWLIGIPSRIGLDFKGRGIFLTHRKKIKGYEAKHVADWQLSLLDNLGVPYRSGSSKLPIKVPPQSQREADEFLKKYGILPADTLIAVAPGGGKSWGKDAVYKQWDATRFAGAVTGLLERKPAKVVLLGDGSENDLLSRVASEIRSRPAIAAGEPIENVCAILLRVKALLCNDGGLLHLANALGVRTVSIFGPVDSRVYGPYGNETPHEVLTQPVPCRPCYRHFRFPPCRYDRRCLDELPVEKAVAALEKMI